MDFACPDKPENRTGDDAVSKRCEHGFLAGMCAMEKCAHFDGAKDWKARQKTRFTHAKGDGRVLRVKAAKKAASR
jgi:hypothetical protein